MSSLVVVESVTPGFTDESLKAAAELAADAVTLLLVVVVESKVLLQNPNSIFSSGFLQPDGVVFGGLI